MSALMVRDLVAGYGAAQVLHGVNLEVEDGSTSILLGANGAGKTTTLRAISGLIKSKGQIGIDGKSILGARTEDILRRGVAHVPQGRGTFNELTVEENLRIGAYSLRKRTWRADINEWYERFPRLRERKSQLAGNLSGGEQQMLALSRALMSRPQLLLLDEPSLGLAPLITELIYKVLSEIASERKMSMLVVEQNANLALGLASRVFVLESGRIALEGSPEEIRGDDAIRRAYLGY